MKVEREKRLDRFFFKGSTDGVIRIYFEDCPKCSGERCEGHKLIERGG